MSNRIYSDHRRNPVWLVTFVSMIFRCIRFLRADLHLTVLRHKARRKYKADYRYFRERGFTRKAAQFNARNTV